MAARGQNNTELGSIRPLDNKGSTRRIEETALLELNNKEVKLNVCLSPDNL